MFAISDEWELFSSLWRPYILGLKNHFYCCGLDKDELLSAVWTLFPRANHQSFIGRSKISDSLLFSATFSAVFRWKCLEGSLSSCVGSPLCLLQRHVDSES